MQINFNTPIPYISSDQYYQHSAVTSTVIITPIYNLNCAKY